MKKGKTKNSLPRIPLPRVIPDCVWGILDRKKAERRQAQRAGAAIAEEVRKRREDTMAKKKSAAKKAPAKGKGKGGKAAPKKVEETPEQGEANLSSPDGDGYQKVYSGGTGDEVTFSPVESGDSCEGVFFDEFGYTKFDANKQVNVDHKCYKLINPVSKKVTLIFDSHVITRFFEQDPGIEEGQWIRLIFDGKKETSPGSGRTVKLYTLQFNLAKQEKYADEVKELIEEMNASFAQGDSEVPF